MPAARNPERQELKFQTPLVVRLSDEERITGRISDEHIGLAVSALHSDGLVVLENAVDVDHVDTLNSVLSNEAEEMAKLPTTHFNDTSKGEKTGNMSQGPPLTPDLMYEDIWANQPASTVISAILGPSPHVNYVNGNTALGGFGGARQKVHADLTFNHGTFPFALVTNYYLIDVSPANGSTELWLGSHRDTSFADHSEAAASASGLVPNDLSDVDFGIREDLLEERRAWAPPIQPVVKKGSVVLRDLRLWHAGLANPSSDPRIMLAFVHTPAWYQCPARVVLPESAKGLTRKWAEREPSPVVYQPHWVPEGVDHRSIKFTPNFSSVNKGYLKLLPKGLGMGFLFGDDGQLLMVDIDMGDEAEPSNQTGTMPENGTINGH